MNTIDKLTMNYMSNKIYNEHVISQDKSSDDSLVYYAEERFYKKRLYLLYKNLFKKDEIKNKSVILAFEKFNKAAIEYLKQEDRTSIIQKELGNTKMNMNMDKSVSFEDSLDIPLEDSNSAENIERDQLAFQNNNNIKSCTLDNYVIKNTHVNKKPPRPPPQKIKVRLKSKELRNKDVPKKKNIGNNYEESSKTKDNNQDKKT